MDRLELAQAGYTRLAPRPGELLDAARSDALEGWLRELVCPVVDDLAQTARFRRLARWPLERLVAGAATPERRLLDAADQALVACARALCAVYQQPDLQAALGHVPPPAGVPAAGVADGQDDVRVARQVACRPWHDLVAPEEYLHPCRDLNLVRCDRASWEREGQAFGAWAEAALVPPGDYLTRLVFLRLAFWREPLRRLWGRAQVAAGQRTGDWPAEAVACSRAWADLAEGLQQLETACRVGPAARLRDSCVVLTQMLAAYGCRPALAWLGLPAGLVEAQRGLIRLGVRRPVCDPRVLERVAAALSDVRALDRGPPALEDALQEAVRCQGLVLLESPRTVYWRGACVAAAWDAYPLLWELLWTLARRARQGQSVDRFGLANPDSERAILDRRSRLRRLLPVDLDRRIRSRGRRTYRLELTAAEVVLFHVEEQEQFHQEGPGA